MKPIKHNPDFHKNLTLKEIREYNKWRNERIKINRQKREERVKNQLKEAIDKPQQPISNEQLRN